VLKADPPERASLKPIRPALSLAGKAELGLGIAHRAGDSLLMDVEERGAFRLSRRQGPGDREGLVGRERQIDKPDRRPRGMDLPAIIRHINETASSELTIRQMREFLGAGFAMRCYAKRRLEALARTLNDLGRQGFAGSALRCAAVGALAGEQITDRLCRRRIPGIESEDLGDAAGGAMLFACLDVGAVQSSSI
jgi:hypothetical protein